jgi:putative copper resistance protein D
MAVHGRELPPRVEPATGAAAAPDARRTLDGVLVTDVAATPGPAWSAVLGTWHATWPAEVAVTALATLYLRTVLRVGGWPVLRTVSALAALAVAVVAVDSGVRVDAPRSFAVHAVLALLLMVVVPALWVAGRPIELLRRGSSERVSAALDRLRRNPVARVATFPVTVLVVYALVVALTHLAPVRGAVAASPAVAVLEQLVFLGAGLLFFAAALGHPSPAVRSGLLLAAAAIGTVVGVLATTSGALTSTSTPDDVRLGGTILWAGGDAVLLLIMVVVGFRWLADRSARGVDAAPHCPVC